MKIGTDPQSVKRAIGVIPTGTGSSSKSVDQHWSLPAIVAHAFSVIDATGRMRVLSRLLRAVGPLALAVVGGGAFFQFLWQVRTVTVEDAARVTSGQVFELASYVQQSNPEVAEQVLTFLSQDVSTMTALGASVVAIAIGILSRQTGVRAPLEKR